MPYVAEAAGASAAAATGSTGGGGTARCALRACSSCTSFSSCSRNCRAMPRARPTQRPTSDTTRGSFSGPSTVSARTKMIRISENRPSNKSRAPFCLRIALLRGFRELSVRAFGADLLHSALFFLVLVHGFFEAPYRLPKIRADRAQFLRTEHDKHHQQEDHQLANS